MSYAEAFRQLINKKIFSSDRSVKELLRLNKNEDWNFLCAAMDIVGDACGVISHYDRFGLSGATKYDDLGERYLRLYGLLAAIYLQQEAVLEVYRIMGVGKVREVKQKIESLEIRKLRNKLSSHGTHYRNNLGSIDAYITFRADIFDRSVTAIRYTDSEKITLEPVDLTKALKAHSELMIDLLDATIEKTIKTIYKGQKENQSKPRQELENLRIKRGGGMVINLSDDSSLVINFADGV